MRSLFSTRGPWARATLYMIIVPAMWAQSATQRFEAASVKPCKSEGGRSGGRGEASPGRLNENCVTVMSLIRGAYVEYANGEAPNCSRPSREVACL